VWLLALALGSREEYTYISLYFPFASSRSTPFIYIFVHPPHYTTPRCMPPRLPPPEPEGLLSMCRS